MSQVIVKRWADENGRRTRRWYWETWYCDRKVAAGFQRTEIEARQRGVDELALAAYLAGVTDGADAAEDCP